MKVTQLDSNVEEVTLQEIQLRRPFRSSQVFDQQVVSRETMPKSMLEQYMACDKPPPLDKLNPYREVIINPLGLITVTRGCILSVKFQYLIISGWEGWTEVLHGS